MDPLGEPGVLGSFHHESGVVLPGLLIPGELTPLPPGSFLGRPVCPLAA
jgi:hypothetical protein